MAARAASSAARCGSGAVAVLILMLLAGGVPSPGVYDAVKSVMQAAIAREQRMGASILRLFFHDCFVQHGQLPGREDGQAQQRLRERLRGDRRHQVRRREGLPRRRLLRRHPRHRSQGQRSQRKLVAPVKSSSDQQSKY